MCEPRAINAATNKDRGVSTTTTSATTQLSININTMVVSTVTMPENSWVMPCSIPSAMISMSEATREIRSPCGLESI